MSRTATGAVLVSCLVALFIGPELGFGPTASTSRADTRHTQTPRASVVVLAPPFVAVPTAAATPAPGASAVPAKPASATVPGDDVWARLRACESPTNGGTRYRGYYQFSQASWARAGGTGDPAAASLEEQTARAKYLAAHSNPAQQWPVCWPRAMRA